MLLRNDRDGNVTRAGEAQIRSRLLLDSCTFQTHFRAHNLQCVLVLSPLEPFLVGAIFLVAQLRVLGLWLCLTPGFGKHRVTLGLVCVFQ
jgi:hypothetical protein